MWHYLPTPENSVVVWRAVGPGWGHRSFAEVVDLHKQSLTIAYVEHETITGVATFTPIQHPHSYWLSVWSGRKATQSVEM